MEEALICSVSPPEEELCAVVLRCSTGLLDTLSLRFARGYAVTGRRQGLQLPADAIRQDESGHFVYLAAGLMAERVDINILYEENGFVLAEGDGLHAGSEILIGGSRLYHGRLLK